MENERINSNIFQLNQIYLELLSYLEKSRKIIPDLEVQRKFYPYTRGYLNKGDPRPRDLAQWPDPGHTNAVTCCVSVARWRPLG